MRRALWADCGVAGGEGGFVELCHKTFKNTVVECGIIDPGASECRVITSCFEEEYMAVNVLNVVGSLQAKSQAGAKRRPPPKRRSRWSNESHGALIDVVSWSAKFAIASLMLVLALAPMAGPAALLAEGSLSFGAFTAAVCAGGAVMGAVFGAVASVVYNPNIGQGSQGHPQEQEHPDDVSTEHEPNVEQDILMAKEAGQQQEAWSERVNQAPSVDATPSAGTEVSP